MAIQVLTRFFQITLQNVSSQGKCEVLDVVLQRIQWFFQFFMSSQVVLIISFFFSMQFSRFLWGNLKQKLEILLFSYINTWQHLQVEGNAYLHLNLVFLHQYRLGILVVEKLAGKGRNSYQR
eukprot:TRINITY_DN5564_c0_g1_i11.p8 TRINITY_DN5564_c0_g1~~TRINITY_DN5564_c0_g1_i11.p8  ORF type:complete len:122 (-),score=1.45 TRINITY_DN5564_c0_g1_i11:97-462(-)